MIKPTFRAKSDQELTGRYIVTFHRGATGDGLDLVHNQTGLRNLAVASDFDGKAVSAEQLVSDDGVVFDALDVCVVNCPISAAERLRKIAPRSAILEVEPEHSVYALDGHVAAATDAKPEYDEQGDKSAASYFIDSGNESWGYQATLRAKSGLTGKGIDVAILDTGIDQQHPDLVLSRIVELQSFVDGDVQDENGHGTHCAGTIFGPPLPDNAPSYGVAHGANLRVGRILDNEGQGTDRSVLAGINWAVAHRTHVVSLSVGADVRAPSVAFEQVGQRALRAGTLLIAAAGNNSSRDDGDFGFVGRPANNHSIMAVGAVDRHLHVADFSARSSRVTGGEIDIVAPGVEVFSAWTLPDKYRAISGTSMASPFVAGVAALYAEAHGVRGAELWSRLIEDARNLPTAKVDVGAGLVQAPSGP